MKPIPGMMRNDRVPEVQQGLQDIGITLYSLSATIGSGQRSKRDTEGIGNLRLHLFVEIAVPDALKSGIVEKIRGARIWAIGPRGHFCSRAGSAVKILTGEADNGAITPRDYDLIEADQIRWPVLPRSPSDTH